MRNLTTLFLLLLCIQLARPQMITTTAAQIKADFNATWTPNTFPRLFMGSAELQRFKDLIATNDEVAVASWAYIQADADAAITKTIPDWKLDAANLRVSPIHEIISSFVPQLVIAFRITGQTKYADKAWAVAQKLMSYPDWGVSPTPNYCDRHFLDAGIAGFNVAMLYDALNNYLTAEQKAQFYAATKRLLLVPAQARYKGLVTGCTGGWNWHITNNNWNGICNGGVVSACLTMFENEPDFLSDVASRGINSFKNYISAFEPDGQSAEGMMYWGYGLMYTVTAFDIMKRILGKTYGYADAPGIKKTGYFPLFTSGPVASLNVGDDGIKSSIANTILWFAKYNNDASLAKLYYKNIVAGSKRMAWFDMFNYNPAQISSGVAPTVALDNYISGIAIHSMVERWQDPNAMYIGIHGGANNASHGHLDAGTFDIQALGQVWVNGNLGSDNYTYPGYFEATRPAYSDANVAPTVAGRWHFYRLRTEGKNCLVFNPDYRPEQDEAGSPRTVLFDSDANAGTVVYDMLYCYWRDVTAYKRAYRLDRQHRIITIQDNYSAFSNSRVWWTTHTKAAISLSTDARTATLTLNGKQMKAVIRYPHTATFQVAPATYLDGRTFPKTTNGSNSGFQRLGICLPASKNEMIRVDFLPIYAENAEELLLDNFEGFSYVYSSSTVDGVVENLIANPLKDTKNPSKTVLKFTINPTVQNKPALNAKTHQFTIGNSGAMFNYLKFTVKGSVVSNFRIKLTNSKDNSSAEFKPMSPISQTTAWENVEVDISKDINGILQYGKSYNTIELIPDYVTNSTADVFYFDNFMLSKYAGGSVGDNIFKASSPVNLSVQYRSASSVKLNWDALANAVSYKILNGSELLATSQSNSVQLTNLTQATNYQLKVVGVNPTNVESGASVAYSITTRKLVNDAELLDDFEGPNLAWSQMSQSVVSRVSNPLRNTINPSNNVLMITRNNPTNNYSGAKVLNELFAIPGYRYLHIKLLRPATINTANNASIKLIEPSTGLSANEKEITAPVNTMALLEKEKWVDFVFDLGTSNPSGIIWNSFFVMPERVANTGISQSYYIDDVILNNDPLPIVGNPVSGISKSSQINAKIYSDNGWLCIDSQIPNYRIEIFNISGICVASASVVGEAKFKLNIVRKGICIVRISSKEASCVQKVIF